MRTGILNFLAGLTQIRVSGRTGSVQERPAGRPILFPDQYHWVIFLGILAFLTYLEEGLWDALVWREHTAVFGLFQYLPNVSEWHLLAWLIPRLALPQMTQYALVGFIWRTKPMP